MPRGLCDSTAKKRDTHGSTLCLGRGCCDVFSETWLSSRQPSVKRRVEANRTRRKRRQPRRGSSSGLERSSSEVTSRTSVRACNRPSAVLALSDLPLAFLLCLALLCLMQCFGRWGCAYVRYSQRQEIPKKCWLLMVMTSLADNRRCGRPGSSRGVGSRGRVIFWPSRSGLIQVQATAIVVRLPDMQA